MKGLRECWLILYSSPSPCYIHNTLVHVYTCNRPKCRDILILSLNLQKPRACQHCIIIHNAVHQSGRILVRTHAHAQELLLIAWDNHGHEWVLVFSDRPDIRV